MELSLRPPPITPQSGTKRPTKPPEPNVERLKQKLISKGIVPTPKILHSLRKKEIQKSLRRFKKQSQSQPQTSPPSEDDETSSLLEIVKAEYRAVERYLKLEGRPWEGKKSFSLNGSVERFTGGKLERSHLEELREVLEERKAEELKWLLDDDVEEVGGAVEGGVWKGVQLRDDISEDEKIRFLVKRLSNTNLSVQDWRFSRVMKQANITFTEMHLLKIVEKLSVLQNWKLAVSVVKWVYSQKDYKNHKSRFVYTKLISVLGKARRPAEACEIFSMMQEDHRLYPDMATYHAIAVTLGQAGLLDELTSVIECMRQEPSKRIRNIKQSSWRPYLQPDVIIYNAVLNACVPCHQWERVSLVLQQMKQDGIEPTETTYGLAMEVMLKAGKYDLVHKYFETMRRHGLATKALTYKVLVKTFWEEGKVDEAVKAVRDMERRGVAGTPTVYYELACCLCNKGRWRDAMIEVEKLKRLPRAKPLEVTFTGMILSSLAGGHPHDCLSIFEYMKDHCTPNIGTINVMLKVYGQLDMFAKAKELFVSIKNNNHNRTSLQLDAYSYNSMIEASASAHQWEYFEYVYKEMTLCGFQIDQSRHARSLVAASRAGKWHLLEHAIDSILEAGEVPHLSLFTEIICHTICQHNFEKTVALINGMAYASVRVSEHQWMDVFNSHRDRIDKEKLHNLLNHLESSSSSSLVMEDPVFNFIKAVKSYVQISSNNIHILAESAKERRLLDKALRNSVIGNQRRALDSVMESNSDALVCDSPRQLLITADRGTFFSKLPSASDILEKWKEERIKDGSFSFEFTNTISEKRQVQRRETS